MGQGSESDEALSEVVVTLSSIRIGALTGPRDAWRFEPLPEGTFALLRPVGPTRQHALLAAVIRGSDGLLYHLDPRNKTSQTSDTVLYLPAPGRYMLWWTSSEEHYAEIVDDESKLDGELSVIIEVRQYLPPRRAPLEKEIEAFDEGPNYHQRGQVRHALTHHILQRQIFYENRSSPIFDVTPACIRALCTVEFMQWYALKAHEASANNMATFEHAAAMIRAAEKGLKDPALEEVAARLFPTPEQRRVFDYFRDYTWRCVATGMRRRLFERSIAMLEGPADLPAGGLPDEPMDPDGGVPEEPAGDWLQAAKDVRELSREKKHGPAVHPHFQGIQGPLKVLVQEGITLSIEQQKLLVSYYEAYLFGATLRDTKVDGHDGFASSSHYRQRMKARMEDWSTQNEKVRTYAKQLLERDAGYGPFFRCMALCYGDEFDFVTRYADASLYARADWLGKLRNDEQAAAPAKMGSGELVTVDWPFWKQFKARIKPLAEGAKAAGKVSKLFGERIAAHDFARGQAEQMLDTLGRLEVTLAGGEVDATRHVLKTEQAVVTLNPSANAGEVRVSLGGVRTAGAPSSITLRFVRETPSVHPGGVPDPHGSVGARTRFTPTAPTLEPYRIEVPAHPDYLRRIESFSKPFAVFGETLNLAIAAATLCDQKAKGTDKAMATFDLTKGVVGVLEGLPAALIAVAPELNASTLVKNAATRAKNLKGLSTWLGRVDHVNKIYKGLTILCSDETAVQYELRQGRAFRAELQHYNDMANVAVGAASFLELGLAAAGWAGVGEILGFSPAVLAAFSATPWGLTLSVGASLVVAGSALALDLTQPWEVGMMEVEQGLERDIPVVPLAHAPD
ncbi:MAG: hypothetical protein RL385_4046, partial [Pseudomonadota bacterium]